MANCVAESIQSGAWERSMSNVAVVWLFSAACAAAGGQLTLEEAIRLTLANHERAKIADAERDAADAGVARARAAFLPELTVSGTYTRRQHEAVRDVGGREVTIQSRDALSATGVATLTLLDPRAFPLYRGAALEREATALAVRESKRSLAFEAAGAFVAALGAEEVREAAARRLALARDSQVDAEVRRRAGLASTNDVTRAVLEVASAERGLIRAEGERDLVRLQLSLLLGVSIDKPLAPPAMLLDAAQTTLPDRAALLARARQERDDLAAARRHADAVDALADEPLLRYLPTIDLFGQVRMTNETGFLGRNADPSAGLMLTWRLFDGGVGLAERRERRALAQIAELQSALLARGLDVEIEAVVIALANGRAAVRQAEVAAQAARQNAEETRQLYRQGLTSAFALADAGVRLFEAEVALANERFGLGTTYLQLRHAVGLAPVEDAS